MLSAREQDVFNFIIEFIERNGKAPLLTEIAMGLGIRSKGVIHRYITALEEANMITRNGRHRGIEVCEQFHFNELDIPLMGTIAAGCPIEAVSTPETLDFGAMFSGVGCYALTVKGDSMIEKGIHDGDIVIIEPASTAKNGDIVVALVDGEDVTLKTIQMLSDGVVQLIPANSSMSVMEYSANRVQIQGLLKGQMRVYR